MLFVFYGVVVKPNKIVTNIAKATGLIVRVVDLLDQQDITLKYTNKVIQYTMTGDKD